MDYPVSEDIAEQQLADMEEEFGAIGDSGARAILVDAAMRGLLDFDSENATVTYRLQKPVSLEDGQSLTELKLTEPDVSQIEQINKGIKVSFDKQGNASADASVQTQTIKRTIAVVAGIPDALLNRAKRRDWAVMEALSGFFG